MSRGNPACLTMYAMCNIMNNAAQHTLDWYRARLGYITGSEVGLIMKAGKGKTFSDTAETYLYSVAGDRMLNPLVVEDDELFEEYLKITNVSSKAMKWGNDQESNARNLYSKITGQRMVEVGSCRHLTIPYFASSPDGFFYDEDTGEKKCLEIKCLSKEKYMKYYHVVNCADDLKSINSQYFYQCHAHMMVTGASSTDFVVYNPFQQKPILITTIEKDEAIANLIAERVRLGNEFIKDIVECRTIVTTA